MKSVLLIAVAGFLFLGLATNGAGELIPVPSFSDHEVPTAELARADSPVWELVHVGILLAALVLATYFALVLRSRKYLLVLTVACLVWFGFVRGGCVCSVGSTQNVAQGLCDPEFTIPLGVLAFFALPLVFTLFFGRTFCAAVCPLGAVQEVLAVRSIKVPRWLDQALGLIPFMYLGAAVLFAATGTAYIICRYDPIVAVFRANGNVNMVVITGCVLLIGLVVGRPYCRYLCPYGALLGLCSRFSKWHVRIVPGECITCHLCEDACPYGAIESPVAAQASEERAQGRRYLGWLLLGVPGIIALMAWSGTFWGIPLSRLDFDVRLAEQVRLEETRQAEETDASDAFRNEGRSRSELYAEGIERQKRYAHLGGWLGAWIGLVLSAKLIQLSVRRQHADYQPRQSDCVSCGRCYKACPVELVRLGLIEDVSEKVEEKPA
ncbi:MAG: 4Fe-4S binding protein [Planctomycetota bacterium]